MNLALGCAMDLDDLFINYPTKKLTSYGKTGKVSHKKQAEQIFKECFKLVLKDIIENRAIFHLPNIGPVKGRLYCKMYKDEDFKAMYTHLYWKDLDYLKSNFKGALPVLILTNKLGQDKPAKQLFIDKKSRKIIVDKLNKGFQYYY